MIIYGIFPIFSAFASVVLDNAESNQFVLRQCVPLQVEICKGIGYNETSMPNLVGHELQSDAENDLQTFVPLIDYACSSQLKLFLCSAFVPMCTPKVPIHSIGPCRGLCENVRLRCNPVLQSFGYPWPTMLDCNRFPKANNQDAMCIEGPGEADSVLPENYFFGFQQVTSLSECSGLPKSHLYVKLQRLGYCAPLCDADILFAQNDKHLAEVWVATWTYTASSIGLVALLFMTVSDRSKNSSKWSFTLSPLVWCNELVCLGWAIRFIAGRAATSCGIDFQMPNVSLLLLDGLSNLYCMSTFLMRYYFGMAALIWWAVLCLGWHRDVRYQIYVQDNSKYENSRSMQFFKPSRVTELTENNFVLFVVWGLPAFQTAAVIIVRLVDADELLGGCFVGNQSDRGLQVFVATPVFCYWIFGSMNLISGFLVARKKVFSNESSYGFGTFLFIYSIPCSLLLFAIIYEFAYIDSWLNVPIHKVAKEGISTPIWPFLLRAFMELMFCIICSAWVLGPKIATLYKNNFFTNHYRSKKVSPNYCPTQKRCIRSTNGQCNQLIYQSVLKNTDLQTQIQPIKLACSHKIKRPLNRARRFNNSKTWLHINKSKISSSQVKYVEETIL